MNKKRRKEIEKALKLLNEAAEIIDSARDDEQEYFDNMPEGLQMGERGQSAENAIDYLESAHSIIDEATGALEDIE